ncbi:unnamed protein product [Paramecium sonneborni]|uniref:Uncharacterized protein n=1 Tax=Paramecium sonneborni TaxID=65129 RepID=A0A8S1K4I0_9CILI|nr:unnamed protein product [Paramecium sonneborni]
MNGNKKIKEMFKNLQIRISFFQLINKQMRNNLMRLEFQLPKQDISSLPQNRKIEQKTQQRRFYRPYRNKSVFPELNSTNALYLSKTSQKFRLSHKEWQEELQTCLQSQSIRGVPNRSKVSLYISKSSQNFCLSSQLFRRPQADLKPLLEISAQKLL